MRRMILSKQLSLIIVLVIASFAVAAHGAAAATRPNVIVIMADDIGAEGLGCYGSTISTTPHLDRMAAEGVLYDIPVTSNKERYSERRSDAAEHSAQRERLQAILKEFMAIESETVGRKRQRPVGE